MSATPMTSLKPEAAERSYVPWSRPLWLRVLHTRETGILALLAGVTVFALATVPNFNGPLTVTFLLLDVTPILLIALPMTMVIITGEIDLSVASILGLSSVTTGVLHQAGAPMGLAVGVALLVGLACGAFNGFLIAYVGLPSLAVTIGTLALFRGLAVGLLGTTAVTSFPQGWTDLARGSIGTSPVPLVMVVFVVLAVGFAMLLHATPFGRGVYDIGLNKEAAHFTGVNVERTKLLLFCLSGVVSALAGVYYTLRFGTARGDNATGLELQVIAAVLLGGVSIFGGRGRLHGVVAGVLLIGVISSALRLQGVTVNVINIIIGLLLVVSVVAPSFLAWLSDQAARWKKRGPAPTTRRPARQPRKGKT